MALAERERERARSADGIDSEDMAHVAPDAPAPPDARLSAQFDRWLGAMERLRLAEYVAYAENRKRLFLSHFLGGVARGVGMAVGFTILGAALVLFLQDLAARNLPVIGDFIARIVSVVQNRLE